LVSRFVLEKPKQAYGPHVRQRHGPHTATHCNTMQDTATHFNTSATQLQYTARLQDMKSMGLVSVRDIVLTLQHTATYYKTLQHTVTHCNTLQHDCNTTATRCNTTATQLQHTLFPEEMKSMGFMSVTDMSPTFQHTATHCNTLQHTATHCNTMQNTATRLQHNCNLLHALKT